MQKKGKMPELLLIVCEGKTEVLYFSILKNRLRLPNFVKIFPELEQKYRALGQHAALIEHAEAERKSFAQVGITDIETWCVCDRDNYKDSFTKLNEYARAREVNLAFSDPQFENYLLQHFRCNKSDSVGKTVEHELSNAILKENQELGLYRKSDLEWLGRMIDTDHNIITIAARNASVFDNHTKKPFFTVQKLVFRLLDIEKTMNCIAKP